MFCMELSLIYEPFSIVTDSITIAGTGTSPGAVFVALIASITSRPFTTCTNIVVGTEHITLTTPIKSVGDHEIVLHAGKTKGTVVITLIAKSK